MKMNKAIFSLALFFALIGMVAADESSDIKKGICDLSNLVSTVLTAVIFLLIVAAAVVYAGGQLLGAETRARATVWATSMFMGALIGVLIYVIVPYILGVMVAGTNGLGTCGEQLPST